MTRSMTFPALLSALVLWTPVLSAQAQGAPCAPDFRAIHDFKVGDVFQYRIWRRSGDPMTLLARGTETIRKYRIHSRRDSGDAILYGVSGSARTSRLVNGHPDSTSTASFVDTLRFVDSAGNRLDRCHGDIVPLPEFSGIPMTYTRLQAVPADTQRFRLARAGETIKILGQEIGTRTGDTTLSPIMDAYFTMAYARGLGLIERSEGGMMVPVAYSETLTGYVRDGKTFGVVSSDQELPLPLSIREAGKARPAPAATTWWLARDAAAFDLRGRRMPQPVLQLP